MDDILGIEDGNHVDDAFYSAATASVRDFDKALKRNDITVEPDGPALSNGDRQ